MKYLSLKKVQPIPCRLCGSQPRLCSVDVHFKKSDDYLFTKIKIECSNPECDKGHRHFSPRATRREAIENWNNSNNPSKAA